MGVLQNLDTEFLPRLRKATGDKPFRIEELDPKDAAWKGYKSTRGAAITKRALDERVKLAAQMDMLTHDGKASRWRTFSFPAAAKKAGGAENSATKSFFASVQVEVLFGKTLFVVTGGKNFKMAELNREDKRFKSKALKHRGRKLTAGMVEERVRALTHMEDAVLTMKGEGKATTYSWSDKVPETYHKALAKVQTNADGETATAGGAAAGKVTEPITIGLDAQQLFARLQELTNGQHALADEIAERLFSALKRSEVAVGLQGLGLTNEPMAERVCLRVYNLLKAFMHGEEILDK